MSRFLTCAALFGALLLAAPVKAEFTQFEPGEWMEALQQFMEWRGEQGTVYGPGAKVEVLLSVEKGGALGSTDGAVDWWTPYNGGAYVDLNYGGANDFRLGFNGSGFQNGMPNVVDIGFALTGSGGRSGPIFNFPANEILRRISIEIDGSWYTMASFIETVSGLFGINTEVQAYLNGTKSNSTAVDIAQDRRITFLWSELFMLAFGGPEFDFSTFVESEGFGVRFSKDLRNQNGLAIIMVTENPVPEPATLVVLGLGLAGLGLARRRRK